MKKLLIERYKGQPLEMVTEAVGVPKGMMRMKGVFGVVDSVNRNNRFYPRADYGKHVQMMQERIDKVKGIPGELEHPNSMNVDYNNVSHKIDKIYLDEATGNIIGELTLLDTPKGKIAQSIARSGMPLNISSRATGSIDERGAVTLENLVTYDLVGTPGFEQAVLGLTESLSDSNGNVLMEALAFDLDDKGNVITESKKSNIESIIESKFNQLVKDLDLDKKISEAVKSSKPSVKVDESMIRESITKELLESIITEQKVDTSVAGSIQSMKADLKALKESMLSTEDVNAVMHEAFITKYTKIIEKWIIENHDKDVGIWIESKLAENNITLVEKITPAIQDWILNEHAPAMQDWILKEHAPAIQDWILKEHAPAMQDWIIEEFGGTLSEFLEKSESGDKGYEDGKGGNHDEDDKDDRNASEKLNDIDAIISEAKTLSTSSMPINETVEQIQKRKLDESFAGSQHKWLRLIPEAYKEIWCRITENERIQIARQASIRTFATEGDVHKFWESRDFKHLTASLTEQMKKQSRKTILENQNRGLIGITKLLQK